MASLVRWSPFGDLATLPREIERVFDWTSPRLAMGDAQMLMPTMDVLHRGDDMVVRMELPGIKPSEVDIALTDDILTISGEHKEEHVTERKDYVLRESASGAFERRVALPMGVDPETIRASFTDGVLEVVVPNIKALETPKSHHIAIGSETRH